MKITDENVVRELKAKNETAIEYVVDRYGGLIRSIVRYHLKDFSACWDECVNDVLLAIWNNISRFDPEKSSLKNWIGAVTKYRCIDYKRRFIREGFTEELDENMASGESPETAVLKRELSEECEELLSCLKMRDRQIFLKHYLGGKSVEEISEESGIKPSAVYNRLSRGRKRLREYAQFSRGERHAE